MDARDYWWKAGAIEEEILLKRELSFKTPVGVEIGFLSAQTKASRRQKNPPSPA